MCKPFKIKFLLSCSFLLKQYKVKVKVSLLGSLDALINLKVG